MSKPALYDCLVVGLGGAGSAALYHLAKAGKKVIGIEAHGIAHDQGSSHGATRIIRGAYHEGSSYVPLLRRAWQLFEELQEDVGVPCIHQTGCLDVGSGIVQSAKAACETHDVEYALMSGPEVSQKYPGYEFGEEEVLYSPFGGILESENCIRAHLAGAEKYGAQIELHARVKTFHHGPREPQVVTEDGRSFQARAAVLAAGAWMPKLIPQLDRYLEAERQVVAWFEVDESVSPLRHTSHPVWIMGHSNGGDYYGFPQFGDQPGFKIGRMHHLREKTDPDAVRREVDAADIAVLREVVADCFPCADGAVLQSSTCLFTNTPDSHFLLDKHPAADNVVMVSACSGHGFKFTSVLGEIAKDLALTGQTPHNIEEFRLRRSRPGAAKALDRFDAAVQ
eukprot:jgi/Ulvmu1/284/UM001_0288.1